MKNTKLTKEEKQIEEALMKGEYRPVTGKRLQEIAQAIAMRKKNTTMTIRVNSMDIKKIKLKAKKLGVKYQTFLSEVIHEVAQ
ncbi:MAG: antitoxin [Candidatus Omnitrophica bacterium]|nr:antitoxin [Candidatus Omnitrophota bacterium]